MTSASAGDREDVSSACVADSQHTSDEEKGQNWPATAKRDGAPANPSSRSHVSSSLLQDDTTEIDALVDDSDLLAEETLIPVDKLNDEIKSDNEERKELLNEEQLSFARIKDGHVESRLSENTTSFIITAPINTSPFAIGLAVGVMKIAVFTLAFVDSQQQTAAIALGAGVAMTQFLALAFAAATQDDIVVCAKYICDGYKAIDGNYDGGVKRGKWALAVMISLVQGVFGLATIVVLTTKSRTVLDVLLNFAAVSFIAKLDSTAFWLASFGFFGSICKTECEKVVGTYFRVRHSQKFGYSTKMALLVGTFLIVFVPWMVVVVYQRQGRNVPSLMVAQFDDKANASLAAYSGVYEFVATDNSAFSSDLFHWTKTFSTGAKGEFGYCQGKWAFFLGNSSCEGQVITSTEIEKYDILKAAAGVWFVDVNFRSYLMEDLILVPLCQQEGVHSCGPNGACVVAGQNKVVGKCSCEADTYGIRCQHSVKDTCRRLEIDDRFGPLPATRILATKFKLLLKSKTAPRKGNMITAMSKNDLVLVYDHPVYVGSSARGQKGVDVLFYSGLRWAIASSVDGFVGLTFDGAITSNMTALADFLNRDDFHSNSEVQKVDIVSKPVAFQSQQDTTAPAGVLWVPLTASTELSKIELIETSGAERLLCADCDNLTNKCQYEGRCNSVQHCECQYGTSGVLCQVPPTGDEHCDQYFNNPAFQFDGGDCCEATCRFDSNSPFLCGIILTNLSTEDDSDEDRPPESTPNYVGFADCNNPLLRTTGDQCGKSGCWAISGPTLSEDLTYSKISSNGRIMLVYQPRLEDLSVYDRTLSSGWVQRPGNILGLQGLGEVCADSIELVTLPSPVFGSLTKNLPVWVVLITKKPYFKNQLDAVFVGWNRKNGVWERFAADLPLPLRADQVGAVLIEDIRMHVQQLVQPLGMRKWDARFAVCAQNGTIFLYETSSISEASDTKQFRLINVFEDQPIFEEKIRGCQRVPVVTNTAVVARIWDCDNGEEPNDLLVQVLDLKYNMWLDLGTVEDICDEQPIHNAVLLDHHTFGSLTFGVACWSASEDSLVIKMVGLYLIQPKDWELGEMLVMAGSREALLQVGVAYQIPLNIGNLLDVTLAPSRVAIVHEVDDQPQIDTFAFDGAEIFQLGNTIYRTGNSVFHSRDETDLVVQQYGKAPVVYSLYSTCNLEKAVSLILSISTSPQMRSIYWTVTMFYSNETDPRQTGDAIITEKFDRRTIIRAETCVDLEGLDWVEIVVQEGSGASVECTFGLLLSSTDSLGAVAPYSYGCWENLTVTADMINNLLGDES